ncbi:hypothetical protein BDQ17DRAFT_1387629 [Cyathus striatus]|nr:hypothetical protein BDQ17DRAFT_1387629 [Cyathus striatus]
MPPHNAFTAAAHSHSRTPSYAHSPELPQYIDPSLLSHYQPFRGRSRARPTHSHGNPGAEPGINPRSQEAIAEYSHFKQECTIDIIDYDAEEAQFKRMNNKEFIQHMHDEPLGAMKGLGDGMEGSETDVDDEDWPPKVVRWINIGGIDWNVLSAVTLRYNLHALALEDVLHDQGHHHSKADYYQEHLFLRILSYSLPKPDDPDLVAASKPITEAPGCGRVGCMPDSAYGELNRAETGNANGQSSGSVTVTNGSDRSSSAEATVPVVEQVNSRTPILSKSGASTGTQATTRPVLADLRQQQEILRIQAITKEDRVIVKHEPLFIFLMRDGTVISVRETPNLDYTEPIVARLHKENSVLRQSEDASLLVQSLLDLAVDRILEMMDEYQRKIHKLEHDILLSPSMNSVRALHILSGDLIMHKRTLDPIKTMLFGLRKYDLDRCIALADRFRDYGSDEEDERSDNEEYHSPSAALLSSSSRGSPAGSRGVSPAPLSRIVSPPRASPDKEKEKERKKKKSKRQVRRERRKERIKKEREEEERRWRKQMQKRIVVEGYFSYKAKVYLADVYDHMDFALMSLDMFAGISENLINYAFNARRYFLSSSLMASYEMNKTMSRLTLATIIFLPLTLLTGYFGMNFDRMWSVQNNSDLFFWKIAIPVMAALIPIFMFDDIRRMFGFIKRRAAEREAMKH